VNQSYIVLSSTDEIREVCEYLATESLLALDTETYPNGSRGPEAYYDASKKDRKLWISDPFINSIRLVQIRSRASEAFIFDLSKMDVEGMAELCNLLSSKEIVWLGHNLKFDYKMIKVNLGVSLVRVWDTMLAAIAIGYATGDKAFWGRGAGLKDVVRDYLDVYLDKQEQASNWGARQLSETQLQYAANDLLHLFDLHDELSKALKTEYSMDGGLQLEFDVMPVVADLEINGIHLDPLMYDLVQKSAAYQIPELETKLCEFIGWPMIQTPPLVRIKTGRAFMPKPTAFEGSSKSPLDSNPIMLKAFKSKNIPVENLQGDYLEDLFDRFAILKDFVSYKDLNKQKGMNYADWVHPITNKIHPEFNQMGATTGRFTCNNPNLQQVPKMDIEVPMELVNQYEEVLKPYFDSKKEKHFLNYRYCFVAPEGHEIASADYSGQEICVMVALSGDKAMIDVLRQPKEIEREGKLVKNMGADLHAMTAELMWGNTHGVTRWTAKEMEFPGMPGKKFRDIAKSIVFGNAYGKTPAGLAADWGIALEEAEKIIALFFKPYKTLKKWLDERGEEADKTRMAIYGIPEVGVMRWRMVNSDRHSDKGALKRAGMNTPIQGTSSLMMKRALVALSRELKGTGGEIIGTVHDEVLVRYPLISKEAVRTAIDMGMKEGSNFFLRDTVPDSWEVGTGRCWTK
jgi:DNA polymerase-1